MRRFLPLIILLGVITLFLFGTFKKNTRVIPTPLIGQEVPIMGLETKFYEDFQKNDLEDVLKIDKIKIINFWASWCLPCEVEHPILMGLSKKSDFIIIGVNYKDTPSNAKKFLTELGNPYIAIGSDQSGKTAIEWGVYGIPETFLLDKDNNILLRIAGPITQEIYDNQLKSFLE